jgi:hypothetical protein
MPTNFFAIRGNYWGFYKSPEVWAKGFNVVDLDIPVFVRALGRTGMSPAEIAIIRELVENDIIGDLIHGRTTVQQAYLELSDRASRASLDTKDFFKLQSFLYTMEAGAYPDVLRSHFIKHGHYKDVPNSPSFSELESLVEQDGRRVVVPQWFSSHKGQYDPAMPGVVERLLSLYPDNFSRQRPLDIAQMSNLGDLVQKLRSIQAKGGGGFPELSLIFKEPDVVQRWNEIRQQWKMVHVPPAYLPTEYELKSAFLRRLGELNELLPVDMRLPVPKLRANARPARLLAEARKAAHAARAKPGRCTV